MKELFKCLLNFTLAKCFDYSFNALIDRVGVVGDNNYIENEAIDFLCDVE